MQQKGSDESAVLCSDKETRERASQKQRKTPGNTGLSSKLDLYCIPQFLF